MALPQGASTSVISAPQRRATSAMRPPKTPFRQMRAWSPGSESIRRRVNPTFESGGTNPTLLYCFCSGISRY